MENETATASIDLTGDVTQQRYEGNFTFKTKITRRDAFAADQFRRSIIGANQSEAISQLIMESFYLAQIKVRLVEAPKWWTASNDGLDLEDSNVAEAVYAIAKQAEDERKEVLLKKAQEAVEALAKKKK